MKVFILKNLVLGAKNQGFDAFGAAGAFGSPRNPVHPRMQALQRRHERMQRLEHDFAEERRRLEQATGVESGRFRHLRWGKVTYIDDLSSYTLMVMNTIGHLPIFWILLRWVWVGVFDPLPQAGFQHCGVWVGTGEEGLTYCRADWPKGMHPLFVGLGFV